MDVSDVLLKHIICIKIRDSFQRIIIFFSVVLSLVNFFGNEDKPGIASKTANQQCRRRYTCLSFCFSRGTSRMLLLWVSRGVCTRVCQSVCLSVSLLKATSHNWFKNAWNFPNWLYFCVKQCSGLMQFTHGIAVGLSPGCMCFESIIEKIYIGFLFQLIKTIGLLKHAMKGCISCIQVLF